MTLAVADAPKSSVTTRVTTYVPADPYVCVTLPPCAVAPASPSIQAWATIVRPGRAAERSPENETGWPTAGRCGDTSITAVGSPLATVTSRAAVAAPPRSSVTVSVTA